MLLVTHFGAKHRFEHGRRGARLGIAVQIYVTFDHGIDLDLGVDDGKNKVVSTGVDGY